MIAEAAHNIGLTNLTMQAVAEYLEVSVTGLYHYVDGKQDLMRLAAEYSAAQIQLPLDHGQHWAVWLIEWATYQRDAFLQQPELLVQFLVGAIEADRIVDTIDASMGLLVRQGFTSRDALLAYQMVSECSIGYAVGEIRDRESTAAGRPAIAEYHRVLAQRRDDELPYLRALIAEQSSGDEWTFEQHLITILMGLATRRGDPWPPIAKAIAGFTG
jgi:AcrR family transcriptional regulator